MKKIYALILVYIIFLPTLVLAHPGRTDSNGCHTCRTNCARWGLRTGQYHCHNGSSNSSNNSTRSYKKRVYGCTNKEALNYNSLADTDDGSCILKVYGCTDKDALNYNSSANTDDGSCVKKVYGCMDSNASNYNNNANVSDGSCTYKSKEVKYKKIKYKTKYKHSFFKKEGKVLRKGKNGKKKITYIVTKDESGSIIKREKMIVEVVKNKVDKIVSTKSLKKVKK